LFSKRRSSLRATKIGCYWSHAYISTPQTLHAVCTQSDIDAIIGASSIAHLQHNLSAVKQDPPATAVLDAINSASETVRPQWPSYFFEL
jgi:hypothetical protein